MLLTCSDGSTITTEGACLIAALGTRQINKTVTASMPDLAQMAGLTEQQVRTSFAELLRAGDIAALRLKGGVYRVTILFSTNEG